MRIVLITWTIRKVGGVESYLESLILELIHLGHTVAFFYEVTEPSERDQIAFPEESASWCVSELGSEKALEALREWKPDLIYAHGLLNPELEEETIKIAPSVFLAHAYYGTCISGAKTFKNPVVKPCNRRFGWKCLLHYYPHRCGGLNPMTMLSNFRIQSRRLELLRSYNAVVTLSSHMQSEYSKHGIKAAVAWERPDISTIETTESLVVDEKTSKRRSGFFANDFRNLLFVGRMDFLKGGHLFLEAIPRVALALALPLRVTLAGDGPERSAWEEKANKVATQNPDVNVTFTGWIGKTEIDQLLNEADLLVLPSIWPEPFGLLGPDAGAHGIPVAAFASGGTLDWLTDGVNGYLAPSDPPTAEGLAKAIINCLQSSTVHSKLSENAIQLAKRFELRNHVAALSTIFENAIASRRQF